MLLPNRFLWTCNADPFITHEVDFTIQPGGFIADGNKLLIDVWHLFAALVTPALPGPAQLIPVTRFSHYPGQIYRKNRLSGMQVGVLMIISEYRYITMYWMHETLMIWTEKGMLGNLLTVSHKKYLIQQ